jgi:ammonia channel protein AmtB
VQGDELKVLTGCILGAFIIIAWVSVTTPIMFFAIKSIGWLRVSPEVEDRGLDEVYHGGLGYNIAGSRMPSRPPSRE